MADSETYNGLTAPSFVYVDTPNANLICCICQTPFVEPTTTRTCAHTFCHDCIAHALGVSSHCPIDRSPLGAADLLPANPIVRHMVDELTVECAHRAEGCAHTCQRQLLAMHLKEDCGFTQVPCPAPDCEHYVLRKDLTPTCVHRKVSCDGCSAPIDPAELESHNLACPTEIVTCPSCNVTHSRALSAAHALACPAAHAACPHASHGCPWTGARRTLDAHVSACTYEVLKGFFAVSDARAAALEEQNAALRARMEAAEGQASVMRCELEVVKSVLGPWYWAGTQDGAVEEAASNASPAPASPLAQSSPVDALPEGGAPASSSLPRIVPDAFPNLASYFPQLPPAVPASSPSHAHPHSYSQRPTPSLPSASHSAAPSTLVASLTSLHTSLDAFAASHDSLARLTELAVGTQAAELGALRAVVSGLRMQVHTILMERSVGVGPTGMGLGTGLAGEQEEGVFGRVAAGWPSHVMPGRYPMFPLSPPGPPGHPAPSPSVKL
ncbi:hypothetical protein FA95DRAFT_1562945 [Auriscalpium vulgare]|uniref:Uncharacterized protein n=1 Tax=Auriscalpium vulgare TaxID=40419 RepID=A0ACB8RJI0_9AGAM|nr:hypothetical protein FA95DRAFT_1562945 [Auriscalpium vulgare]